MTIPAPFDKYQPEWEYEFDSIHPTFTALGAVVWEYSQLDHCVSRVLTKVLKLEFFNGEAVTSEMSFKTKVDLIKAMLHFKPGDDSEFKALMNLVIFCNDRRNTLLHSTYHHVESENAYVRFKVTAKGKVKRATELVDAPEYMRFAAYVFDVRMALGRMFALDGYEADKAP